MSTMYFFPLAGEGWEFNSCILEQVASCNALQIFAVELLLHIVSHCAHQWIKRELHTAFWIVHRPTASAASLPHQPSLCAAFIQPDAGHLLCALGLFRHTRQEAFVPQKAEHLFCCGKIDLAKAHTQRVAKIWWQSGLQEAIRLCKNASKLIITPSASWKIKSYW